MFPGRQVYVRLFSAEELPETLGLAGKIPLKMAVEIGGLPSVHHFLVLVFLMTYLLQLELVVTALPPFQ